MVLDLILLLSSHPLEGSTLLDGPYNIVDPYALDSSNRRFMIRLYTTLGYTSLEYKNAEKEYLHLIKGCILGMIKPGDSTSLSTIPIFVARPEILPVRYHMIWLFVTYGVEQQARQVTRLYQMISSQLRTPQTDMVIVNLVCRTSNHCNCHKCWRKQLVGSASWDWSIIRILRWELRSQRDTWGGEKPTYSDPAAGIVYHFCEFAPHYSFQESIRKIERSEAIYLSPQPTEQEVTEQLLWRLEGLYLWLLRWPSHYFVILSLYTVLVVYILVNFLLVLKQPSVTYTNGKTYFFWVHFHYVTLPFISQK